MTKSQQEVIVEYAIELERIYRERTAGDYTFVGILSAFVSDYTAEAHE